EEEKTRDHTQEQQSCAKVTKSVCNSSRDTCGETEKSKGEESQDEVMQSSRATCYQTRSKQRWDPFREVQRKARQDDLLWTKKTHTVDSGMVTRMNTRGISGQLNLLTAKMSLRMAVGDGRRRRRAEGDGACGGGSGLENTNRPEVGKKRKEM
ncbi:hypothetical protein ACRALDRAFT_1065178, partial [Sodiomyces alcalophilus JCM 7366]|uniref:uncharacterized protein n=1 Tax=Sodiomyces alcalophilus JCM 7366 TaxID=591952 RepID=UPI0039B531F1